MTYQYNTTQGQQIYQTDNTMYQYNVGTNVIDPLVLQGTNYEITNNTQYNVGTNTLDTLGLQGMNYEIADNTQYNAGANPLDPLGLQGANYTLLDTSKQSSSKHQNNTYNYNTKVDQQINLNQNQVYTQQVMNDQKQPNHLNQDNNYAQLYQHQYGQNIVHPIQNQNIKYQANQQQQIQQKTNHQQQANTHQNMNQHQQIYLQNNIPQTKMQQQIPIQTQIKPQNQPKIKQQNQPQNPYQNKPQIQPQPQFQNQKNIPQLNQQGQANIRQNQREKINVQYQPKTYMPHQNNNVHKPGQSRINQYPVTQYKQNNQQKNINQFSNPHQNIQNQNQTTGLTPEQIHFQKYVRNQIPNQNQNQNQMKIEIPYDKNNPHFVNKPIYEPNLAPSKETGLKKNSPNSKEIKNFDNIQTLEEGTLVVGNIKNDNKDANNKKIISIENNETLAEGTLVLEDNNKNNTSITNTKIEATKYLNPDLSEIKEEEMDIKQSGLSKNISNLKKESENNIEFPMEEKQPEPENIVENNNEQNNERSIEEQDISDSMKLDHLPTANSIMQGKYNPLPPPKKHKYQ